MTDEELKQVHVAAPAALGDNVLRYAPAGPVQLTAPQRAEVLRELDACKQRIADLKFALGDNAGWFDRAMAAEKERDRLRAENQRLVAAVKALVEFWDGQDESGRMTAVEADELTHLESELRRAIERK